MSDPIRKLKELGRELATIPISRLPKSYDRTCLICCNNYTSYQLSLGVGPINDAVNFAKCVKSAGFEIFFLHNPHEHNFLDYLDSFFKNCTGHFIFYYVGHGTEVTCTQGDEPNGMDEAFVFDDGVVIDDDLLNNLINNKNPSSRLTLITDACHSGSIWDIQEGCIHGKTIPPNIMSISGTTDAQTAKQTMIGRTEQGVFTYNLTKIINAQPSVTPAQLQVEMKKSLRAYTQTVTIATSSNELLTIPLLF